MKTETLIINKQKLNFLTHCQTDIVKTMAMTQLHGDDVSIAPKR